MNLKVAKTISPAERRIRFGTRTIWDGESKSAAQSVVVPKPVIQAGVFEHEGDKFFAIREGIDDEVVLCIPSPDGGLVNTGEKVAVPGDAKFFPLAQDTPVVKQRVTPFQSHHEFQQSTKAVVRNDDDVVVDYRDVRVTGLASDYDLDRDNETIKPGAYRRTLAHFRKNPVMLADHTNNTRSMVGSYTKIREADDGLHVEGTLSNAPDEFTTRIRFLVAENHLKAFSVGGIMRYCPTDYSCIEEVDLFEISIVPIPANPRTLLTTLSVTIDIAKKAFQYAR